MGVEGAASELRESEIGIGNAVQKELVEITWSFYTTLSDIIKGPPSWTPYIRLLLPYLSKPPPIDSLRFNTFCLLIC